MSKRERDDCEALRSQLMLERSSFIPHWQDLTDYIDPRRGRFWVSDVNRGDKRNRNIIDSTGTLSARTLESGMMSGITSPARPWFRLSTPDPDLSESGAVKDWLHIVGTRMSNVFLKSNLYNALPTTYGDMGKFGTAALFVDEDIQDTIRTYVMPIGSYCIANDDRMKVCTFLRDFRMTVRQTVMKFGKYDRNGKADFSMFSAQVKSAWDRSDYDQWVDTCHVVKPNPEWNPRALESRFKKYVSYYYERGMGSNATPIYAEAAGQFLEIKGHDFFPVLAPRWGVTGEDAYGTKCPGMDALGDIRALQLMQRRKAQAIDKMVNPPMVGPSILKNTRSSIASGDITYVDGQNQNAAFRPAHEVRLPLNDLRMDIQDTQNRIQRAFYEDLFLMLAQSDRRQITAREIEERHEEKLLALGPVLEQLNQDLLDPLIDIVYDIMERDGQIPEPPEELKGVPLKVEYISIMAQAQKLVGIGGLDRLMSSVGQAAAVFPNIIDKIDADQYVDRLGDMLSTEPGIIRTDEAVAQMRGERAQAQQQAAQAEQQAMMAQSAKTLSETNLEGDNALSAMIESGDIGEMI